MTDLTFTNMNAIIKKYEGKDFVVLVFPVSDFSNQEAYDVERPEEFLNELKYVRPGGGFEPLATEIFKKVAANGEHEAPFYTFFKDSCPTTYDQFWPTNALTYSPQRAKDIWWNYEKFLIARNGSVYARYSSMFFMPGQIGPDIDLLLAQPA